MIILVNILVIIENIIDINWIWFGFDYETSKNLSQLVHEGTYLLILSILLSIGILLYYFRGNQNFYIKNKILKYGAYLWIIQNVIMSISVALRNLHYINYYGLSHKRIGVLIFLLLVLGGLILLYIKIRNKKSAYYLLRLNSWNIYFIMIFISLFNWDILIAKYNVRHNYQSPVDMFYLFSLSDNGLPIIHNNWENIISGNEEYRWAYFLNTRIRTFMEKEANSTWQSWNYADHKTYMYFLKDFVDKEK